jgi:ethanolamine permease
VDQRPATPPGSALLSAAAEPPAAPAGPPALKRALGPVMLWGLGVGYVISGEYMGWNLGLPVAGTFGLLIAFALITVLYVTFVFSYTELACAIPRAGGVFVYAVRGLGLPLGFVGGVAQAVEFIFAPPAIALGIGEYVNIWLPLLDKRWIAALAYLLFTAINVWGVKQAAVLELVVTVLAV